MDGWMESDGQREISGRQIKWTNGYKVVNW